MYPIMINIMIVKYSDQWNKCNLYKIRVEELDDYGNLKNVIDRTVIL